MFGLFLIILAGVGIYVYRHSMRDRPTDRSAIDTFAMQSGLHIISVTRSYSYFRYFFRGMGADGLSSTTRFYVVTAEDSEGNRGHIHIAFDPVFGTGQPAVLEAQGLILGPLGELASLAQTNSGASRISWTWYERLVLWGAGAGVSGFIFSGILQQYLSPPKRPVFPDAVLGYTHLFEAKYGDVYGTYFEYLTVTYGVWVMWCVCAAGGLFGYIIGIRHKSRTYPLQICVSAAISMALYYAIWRVLFSGARS